MLAEKRDQPYSNTLAWMRCKLSFALLRSAIQCIRGARSAGGRAFKHDDVPPIDLVVAESNISLETSLAHIGYTTYLHFAFYLFSYVNHCAYHEMAKVCREMPRHYKIKGQIKELNEQWNIRPTPEAITGVQQPLEERIRVPVHNLLQTLKDDAAFRKDLDLRVKLYQEMERISVSGFMLCPSCSLC